MNCSRMGLAATAVLAASVLLATGAQASPPEVGRCVKVAPGTGAYTGASCVKVGGKREYAWLPGAVHARFTVTLPKGVVTYSANAAEKIVCHGLTASGTYLTPTTIGELQVTDTGCNLENGSRVPCQSTSTLGEIVSRSLHGYFGVVIKDAIPAKEVVGLDVVGPGAKEEVSAYECAGISTEIVGSVIAPIKANRMQTAAKLKYVIRGNVQYPPRFELQEEDVLFRSVMGNPLEVVGVTANLELKNEEALEINSVV
jgi:hypothetical protein